MAAIAGPSKDQIQTLAREIREQPSNRIPGGYYNGELTFQVDARRRTVQVIWKTAKDGANHSKELAVAGAVAGLMIGSFVAGPPTGLAAAKTVLAGGIIGVGAGLALGTAVYVYRVDALSSKASELRVTAGKICNLIIDSRTGERGVQDGLLSVVDPVTLGLMMEPINLNCHQGPTPHVADLLTVSEIILTNRGQGIEPKCPLCRTPLVQENLTYHLDTKKAVQQMVSGVLEHLKSIELSDPTVIKQASREKNQPDLLERADQIIEQNRNGSLNGAQAYILASVIEQYTETWNSKIDQLDARITTSLKKEREEKQITPENMAIACKRRLIGIKPQLYNLKLEIKNESYIKQAHAD